MNAETSPSRRRWRPILIAIALLLTLGALLALDLWQRGLVWQFAWSQTGEEDPLGQVRGLMELGANLLRPQPDTAPLTPIQHADSPPYGINVFLQKEVEEPKIRAMLAMIRDAGFVWLRQEFTWEDLEVDGRGQFTDSRNDLDGDGVPDTLDAWAKYDRIVDLTEEYGLRLLVRLSNPPSWSRSDPNTTAEAPPDNFQDFVNFAAAVAQRYQGRIQHYQIWNEPNIYPEWGEAFADPEAYTDMLCRTYEALKAIDPNIVIVSAAIAPTISLDGYYGLQDVIYLQRMYDAGAADCFDVLAAQGYGLRSGPTDRRLSLTQVNYQRHVLYRDLMVANGDAHKPIWLSEAAWNHVLDAELPPEQITQYDQFGTVTQEQAARYMPLGYERARQEWPWIGQISYWFFTRPDPFEAGQAFYYFRMVEPDYSPDKPTFTPLPVYHTMRDYITSTRANPILYRGTHQAQTWEITHGGENHPEPTLTTGPQFGDAVRTSATRFSAHGTHVRLLLRVDAGTTVVRVNGEQVATITGRNPDWQSLTIAHSLLPQTFEVELVADNAGYALDSITVLDRTWAQIGPLLVISVGVVLLLLGGWIGGWLRRRG